MTVMLVALGWAGSTAAAQDRVAFLIGNSNYDTVTSLDNPSNDASDFSVALEGLGFRVFLGIDLDNVEMRAMAEEFAAASMDADASLFFYAGHGFQVNGQNYLVPTDAAIDGPDDVATQTVPLNEILQKMEESKGLKLVFLDACRNNPFGDALKSVAAGDGLARVGNDADFMFAYATQPDNVAYDGIGRNSFFTEAVLNNIYTPGQDIASMMIAVRRNVIAATGGNQIPWDNSSLTRQFRFDNSPVTASEDTLLYQVAISAKDPELMQLYVDTYPQGPHVGEALAFLDSAGATGNSRTRSLGTVDEDEQAERLWNLAQRSRIRTLLDFYLEQYPDGVHVDQARRLLGSIPRPEDASAGRICERLATHPRDASATSAGVPFSRLQQNAFAAIQACSAATIQSPSLPHYTALLARATAASGDLDRAVQLYRTAADNGDLRAMVSLAQLMESGTGMAQDATGALALYEKAADAGSEDAMINLAITLFEGKVVPADSARAVSLLQRAADQGSPKALFNLGVLAQDGQVGQPEQALDYFLRAARDGEYEGYRAAAILLDEGRGVARDPNRAASMLLRGAAEDNGSVVRQLTEASDQWSRDTLKSVQTMLREAGYYNDKIDGRPGPKFADALTKWRNGGFKPEVLLN